MRRSIAVGCMDDVPQVHLRVCFGTTHFVSPRRGPSHQTAIIQELALEIERPQPRERRRVVIPSAAGHFCPGVGQVCVDDVSVASARSLMVAICAVPDAF